MNRPASAPQTVFENDAQALRTLGVVSFLNAKPLCKPLVGQERLTIKPAVPAKLSAMLANGECDVALLPIVDFWRCRDHLEIISDACIASDGETTTVRVFSKSPPDTLRKLHVDGDSRTSVVLARLIWLELYGVNLELSPWRTGRAEGSSPDAEAVLLIGDKVVSAAPTGFGFEVDLGAAWKHLTGLPFVFAAWYARKDADLAGELAPVLQAARDAGVAAAEEIALQDAEQHGWPTHTAVKYLRDVMRYTLTDDMRTAMRRFFQLAEGHALLP
ncbi:MAG: menaquinone biosynthesis protein [Planctomycetota bacterium]